MAQDAALLTPTKASPLAETDELLSQLAGSEIDRLLAEAESASALDANKINSSPSAAAAGATDKPATSETAGVVEADIEKLLATADLPAPTGSTWPAEPSAPGVSPPGTGPADDSDRASTVTEGLEKAALLAAAGFDSTTSAGIAAQAPPPPQKVDDERAAILSAAGFDDTSNESTALKAAYAKNHVEDKPALVYAPTPFYLKPLEWLSKPLDSYSPTIRIALGRVAFATLFNAIAVITYVRFFRKH
jgi:hypothetical protein